MRGQAGALSACAAHPLRAQGPFAARGLLSSGPSGLSASGFLPVACAPETPLFFAPALIAAKPVKPCDGGVFEGLNLLSKKEQNARIAACQSRPNHPPPGRSASAFDVWLLPTRRRIHRNSHANQTRLRRTFADRLPIRSCFNSSQARQTVRWGPFRGPELALENAAKRAVCGLRPACVLARAFGFGFGNTRSASITSAARIKPASGARLLAALPIRF